MRKLFMAVSTMLFAACVPKFPTLTPDEFEQAIARPATERLVKDKTLALYCKTG